MSTGTISTETRTAAANPRRDPRTGERIHPRAVAGKEFTPGLSPVLYAGRVFDEDDVATLVDSSLDFWLTTGRFAISSKNNLRRCLGVREARAVQLRIVGQPAGDFGAYVAETGRPALAAGR